MNRQNIVIKQSCFCTVFFKYKKRTFEQNKQTFKWTKKHEMKRIKENKMSKCKRFKKRRKQNIYYKICKNKWNIKYRQKIALILRYKNKANLDYLKWLIKMRKETNQEYKTRKQTKNKIKIKWPVA